MNIKNFNYSYLFDAQTEYYLTDHLGSIRTTIDQNGAVIGFDDYDPFGNVLPGRSYNLGTPNDLNKFTGHERDQEGGLDLDYMLARNYDSELGRFYSVDPLKLTMKPNDYLYHSITPYSYTMSNPLIYIDPNGLWVVTVQYSGRAQLALSLSTSFGLAVDDKGTIGIFFNIGGGIGPGAGATAGVEFTLYPFLDDIDQIKGLGFVGGMYAAAGIVGSFEVSTTSNFITNNPFSRNSYKELGYSVGLTPLSIGLGVGNLYEAGYTFLFNLTEAYNEEKAIKSLVNGFGFSRKEATDMIQQIMDAKNKIVTKAEKTKNFFDRILNMKEGNYVWDDNKQDWVRQNE